jgi:hypothetical protein
MKKVKLVLGSLFLISMLTLSGCFTRSETSDDEQQKATEKLMNEANSQIGMPAIVNFQEKKIMKMIYELRDQESLVCYAYLYNRNDGTVGQYLGRCIGYGLPYSTQFSNPEKRVDYGTSVSSQYDYNLPQPEPNGLFMPEGLSATWLLLLDDNGDPHPVYVEPEIIVSPFKLSK